MNYVGIIGLGLMGGSLGLALKKYYNGIKVLGRDIKKKNEVYSLENGIIDEIMTEEHLSSIDLIVIAVPARTVPVVIKSLLKESSYKGIITDMASTKSYINRFLSSEYPDIKYIGGHPLAGREVSGPQGADADLFQGKKYILTPSKDIEKDEFDEISSLLSKIGAEVIFLNADEHDSFLAFTSHLPQLLATLLSEQLFLLNETGIDQFVGQGFLDMTRIASSDPQMWLDIFLTNRDNLDKCIGDMIDRLNRFREALMERDEEELYNIFIRGRNKRLDLIDKRGCK